MSNDDPKEPNVGWVLGAALLGAVALLGAYLHFRSGFTVGALKDHADLGNALAPMVAFLTLMAVVAALWSVQVQRAELALQRKELQETRAEMVEQRKQLESAARAQRRLACVTAALAREQKEANRLAWFHDVSQRRANLATLYGALATAEQANLSTVHEAHVKAPLKALKASITRAVEEEVFRIDSLEKGLGLVMPDDRRTANDA